MRGRSHDAAQRSDAAVFADARRRLDECPTVPGTVRVHVDNGLVTLTGSVKQPSQRAEAEQAVRAAIGTLRLLNEITVSPGPDPEGFDAPGARD